MDYTHSWELAPAEARALQVRLSAGVRLEDDFEPLRLVAGVDVGFEADGSITRAAVAVLDAQSLTLVDQSVARQPTRFPYIPGLLSFRELPTILEAIASLTTPPDIYLCDGQGIAHPRRLGIASHLGVLLDVPAIGVGKSRLVGEYEEPAGARGAWSGLYHRGERVGAVLRTRAGVKPLFISPGHRISLERVIEVVMACTTRFKLPETTRWAHRLASDPRFRND
ncbi:deoxyribonuclease V [Motiliproteus sp. SC1-56]|uniref:deoxyribonuclease V n=1 Tax=Motiliproteus sp. SC1-56 TaxID=2799565 RepID=UPI001A8EBCDC